MRARATEPAPEAVEFDGVVCSGLGEGAGFTALGWVGDAFERVLGERPWPGTLNLRMRGAAWRRWRAQLGAHAGVRIDPPPGFCAALCVPMRLGDGGVRCAAVFPDVPGYPDDKVELVAPVALRAALGLRDGDAVRVRVG